MIPYVGSIFGGIVAFFLILLVAPITLILLIAIIISQLVDGFIVGPKIIGNKVGLSTFWVMVSMIIFGNLFWYSRNVFRNTYIINNKIILCRFIKRAEQGGKE